MWARLFSIASSLILLWAIPASGLSAFHEQFESGMPSWGNDGEATWVLEDGTLKGSIPAEEYGRSFVWPEHVTITNGVVEFKVRGSRDSDFTTLHCGVQVRGHYWLLLDLWKDVRITTSEGDILGINPDFEPMNHRWYQVHLWLEDAQFSVYIDGALVLQCVDYTWPDGQLSFFMYKYDWADPGGVSAYFDDIRVSDIAGTDLRMDLNRSFFRAGDQFRLSTEVPNVGSGGELDLYVVLDITAMDVPTPYYFYPSWGIEADFERIMVPADDTYEATILEFQWPSGVVGEEHGLTWWGAITLPGTYYLVDFERIDWGFGP